SGVEVGRLGNRLQSGEIRCVSSVAYLNPIEALVDDGFERHGGEYYRNQGLAGVIVRPTRRPVRDIQERAAVEHEPWHDSGCRHLAHPSANLEHPHVWRELVG